MTPARVLDPRGLAKMATVIATVTAAIAVITAIALGHRAEGWLGFGFGGVKPAIGQALSIFLDNARLTVAVGVAALVAQARQRAPRTGPERRLVRGLGWVCDLAVIAAVVLNAALVGLALGTYRWKMFVALLPHGPFELAGYCVALDFYLVARRRPLTAREWLRASAAALGLLAIAAALETFAWMA